MSHGSMSASKLMRLWLCPGSYHLCNSLPVVEEKVEQWTQDGTDQHAEVAKIVQAIVENIPYDPPEAGSAVEYSVQVLLDVFSRGNEVCGERGFDFDKLGVEGLEPIGKTTADLVIYEPFSTGTVFDWKFGFKRLGSAKDNKQLRCYAFALSKEQGLEEVTVFLVDANRRQTDMAVFDTQELFEIEKDMRLIVANALKKDAPLCPDPDACEYCPAKKQAACPALRNVASMLPVVDSANSLSGARLGHALSLARMVKKWAGDVEKHARAVLAAGGEVYGYELKPGRKDRYWKETVNADTLKSTAMQLGVVGFEVELEKKSILSPAQFEKKIGRSEEAKKLMANLIEIKFAESTLEQKGE
jgi:hypothetical protein